MSEMFKDCFAYRVKYLTPDIIWEECDALEINECKQKGKCSFYKKVQKEEEKDDK